MGSIQLINLSSNIHKLMDHIGPKSSIAYSLIFLEIAKADVGGEDVTQIDIAQKLEMSATKVNNCVMILSKHPKYAQLDLATLVQGDDQRSKFIKLTAKGREILKALK